MDGRGVLVIISQVVNLLLFHEGGVALIFYFYAPEDHPVDSTRCRCTEEVDEWVNRLLQPWVQPAGSRGDG